MLRKTFIAMVATAVLSTGAAALDDRVLTLPGEYRTAYDNYLIADRLNQDDQVISLYANATAREAARAGQSMPDGAIIVGEIYKAQKDAGGAVIESMLGRRIPGLLAAIVVMERRAEWAAQYPAETGLDGWEFEVFSPAGKNLGKDTTACRECHAPLDGSAFLFSYEHLGGAN